MKIKIILFLSYLLLGSISLYAFESDEQLINEIYSHKREGSPLDKDILITLASKGMKFSNVELCITDACERRQLGQIQDNALNFVIGLQKLAKSCEQDLKVLKGRTYLGSAQDKDLLLIDIQLDEFILLFHKTVDDTKKYKNLEEQINRAISSSKPLSCEEIVKQSYHLKNEKELLLGEVFSANKCSRQKMISHDVGFAAVRANYYKQINQMCGNIDRFTKCYDDFRSTYKRYYPQDILFPELIARSK